MRAETIVSVPRVRRRTIADRLCDSISTLARNQARLLSHKETPWASITFAGARHRIMLLFEGFPAIAAGEEFIDALPEHEFTLPGQLVAEAQIVAVEHRLAPDARLVVTVEILLLDDA